MDNVFNRDKEPWIRPWNEEKFDDLYNRDERFFALVIKGLLSWLNRNIVLYNKSINHFVFNTGSSYLYIESNGYEYSVNETTGEDTMYMTLPRCIIELADVNIATDELSSPYGRGYYEHRSGNMICGYNADIRRLPLELTINAKYYLSNFNESIVLLQELIDKMVFQKYYKITYLGQEIQCSIEFPGTMNPELNKIDMSSPEPNQRNVTLDFKICTNYPVIDERSEIPTDKVIATWGSTIHLRTNDAVHKNSFYHNNEEESTVNDNNVNGNNSNNDNGRTLGKENDRDRRGGILSDQSDGYDDMGLELRQFKNKESDVIDHDEENILKGLDFNKDGKIDKDDIIKLLDHIKYGHYVTEGDLNNDLRINYEDLIQVLKIVNDQKDVSVDYDEFMNKIYINHTDTGEQEEIDLTKYKIE